MPRRTCSTRPSLARALADDAAAYRQIDVTRTIDAQRGFAALSVETDALAMLIQAASGRQKQLSGNETRCIGRPVRSVGTQAGEVHAFRL